MWLRTHRFWAGLGSDLGGVWLFRMHCRCAYVFCPATALLSFSCNGFEEDVSDPCGRAANASFWACLSSDLGGVWLFRMHCR